MYKLLQSAYLLVRARPKLCGNLDRKEHCFGIYMMVRCGTLWRFLPDDCCFCVYKMDLMDQQRPWLRRLMNKKLREQETRWFCEGLGLWYSKTLGWPSCQTSFLVENWPLNRSASANAYACSTLCQPEGRSRKLFLGSKSLMILTSWICCVTVGGLGPPPTHISSIAVVVGSV